MTTTPVAGLTRNWRYIALTTWGAVLFSMVAVGVTGRTVGKPPWWLGPSVDPAPILYVLIVAGIVAAPIVTVLWWSHRAPFVGLCAAIGIALCALPDLSASPGIAVVELAIAIAAAFGSVALYAGRD
jgi:hypothetical protein